MISLHMIRNFIVYRSITHIEALGDSDEDQLTLQAYNKAIIHAVQHVVYCEEIFQTVMNEVN